MQDGSSNLPASTAVECDSRNGRPLGRPFCVHLVGLRDAPTYRSAATSSIRSTTALAFRPTPMSVADANPVQSP